MFAEIEQKIIDHLREGLGDAVTVEPVRELDRVPELRQKTPACWVVYDGYRLGPAIPGVNQATPKQQLYLDWFVVVADKSARGNGESNAARDLADALSSKVINLLLGYHVGGGRYLRLNEAPGPEYDAGYCHLPLAFYCPATFSGQQSL